MAEAILEAARSLLQSEGDGFTMEQLEAASGLSRATIYRRVGGKKALLERLAAARGEAFEPPDLKRDILAAARTVLAREGLAAATIEQIAGEAGVGVATVYRHFGSKERLLLAFVDTLRPRAAVRDFALHPSDDVAADLEHIVGTALPFFHAQRDILRLVMLGSETDRRYLEHLRRPGDSTLTRLTEYFRAQRDAGRLQGLAEPEDLALALVGMMLAFGIVGPLHYGTELTDPAASSRRIVRLFLEGLRGGA